MSVETSAMQFTKSNNVSVHFRNVSLCKSNWVIFGLNLFMVESTVQKFNIFSTTVGNHQENNVVKIANSMWRELNVSDGYRITIFNSTINGSIMLEKTLVNIRNSELSIFNCMFRNLRKSNSGPAILYVEGSQVKIKNIQCENSHASNGLIQIENNSQLAVENSIFERNGYTFDVFSWAIVSIKFNTTVRISNCTFKDNKGLFGSCLYCDNNTTVTLRNCFFANNSAVNGGVIFVQNIANRISNKTKLPGELVQIKKLLHKNWKDEEKVAKEVAFTEDENQISNIPDENDHENLQISDDKIFPSKIIINGCNFESNEAQYKGGALYIEGSSIELHVNDCYFTENAAGELRFMSGPGGGIYVQGTLIRISLSGCYMTENLGALAIQGTSKMSIHAYIYSCSFNDNNCETGGDIYACRAFVKIFNSSFTNSNAVEGGSMQATDSSAININGCTFTQVFGFFNGVINIKQSVRLTMMDSKMQSIQFVVGFSFFTSSNNCTITICRSYFTTDHIFPAYTVVFNIHNFTTIIVNDSLFETNRGINLQILSASGNCHIDFQNCVFNKISGFMALYNSSVHISNSKITNCVNTLQTNGFIQISDGSHFQILNTTVADNRVLETDTLILVKSNSSLTMFKCLYTRNYMASHIKTQDSTKVSIKHCRFLNNSIIENRDRLPTGLIVLDESNVTMKECHVTRTVIEAQDAQVMAASKSNVTVVGSHFRHNNASGDDPLNLNTNLIVIQLSNNVNFTNTQLFHNVAQTALTVQSKGRNTDSFLLVNNCSFKTIFSSSIYTQNISDVIIKSSHFLGEQHSQYLVGGVATLNAINVRVQDSVFNATEVRQQFYFTREISLRYIMDLFTLNSTFSTKATSLQTSSDDFLNKAESMGFIDTGWLFEMKQQETEYASSRCLFI